MEDEGEIFRNVITLVDKISSPKIDISCRELLLENEKSLRNVFIGTINLSPKSGLETLKDDLVGKSYLPNAFAEGRTLR